MNQSYVRRKLKEISKEMREVERLLNKISQYAREDNEYYMSSEYKRWEELNAKYQHYYYELK